MKKFEQSILFSITLIFVGLMIGLLIGRNSSSVIVSKYQHTTAVTTDTGSHDNETTAGKININFASAKELTLLPGIGDTYAQRIVEYREKHGPYLTIYDLEKVSGIGKKRIDAIAQFITVGG